MNQTSGKHQCRRSHLVNIRDAAVLALDQHLRNFNLKGEEEGEWD
jgi:hypothetical protein